MSDVPRVVVVSTTAISPSTASGYCLRQLFDGWPADRLLEVVRDGDEATPTVSQGRLVAPNGRLTPEIIDTILAFEPDLLYVRAVEWPERWWDLGQRIAQIAEVPYVAHVFDDVVGFATIRWGGTTGRLRAVRRDVALRSLLDGAADVFACSERHAGELAQRYGVAAVPFVRWIEPRESKPPAPGETYRIAYTGRCNPRQHAEGLRLVGEAVAQLTEAGHRVAIECIGPNRNDYDQFFASAPHLEGVVTYLGDLVDRDDQLRFVDERDAVLVALNFDAGSLRYIGRATSSKALDALATDQPALVVGSPQMESVDWAKRTGWSDVVDTPDPTTIAAALLEMMERARIPDAQRQARVEERRRWSRSVVTSAFAERLARAATAAS